eukprot:CAMPEP_0198575796 /NCGR_PEP_ID=MMETSP1462-20131121/116653_1 /TAXON_ID=1333877 /ORGANISM="Brandtodinium nutriculum, Strain RCC3387" /LENGTH=31 /DNA_ID= /DNA_START= /DNA_END= /DNA_ORIENTATION=
MTIPRSPESGPPAETDSDMSTCLHQPQTHQA